MKLSEIFEVVAHKQMASVDLPGKNSHQHEFSGVSALKTIFGTAAETTKNILWVYFSKEGHIEEQENSVRFYDARAKSAQRTGRSEWRLYYFGNFIERVGVKDLFVVTRTKNQEFIGMIFAKDSGAYEEAISIFRIDTTSLFDNLPEAALESREWDPGQTPVFSSWIQKRYELTSVTTETITESNPAEIDPESESDNQDEGLRSGEFAFKPRARLLVLLGDQLIRNAGIAVFELVKNAYDADAREVTITLSHVTIPERGQVIVEDDGCGMSWHQIVNVWLEPGTDYRQQQKSQGYRSPLFGRLPLGEKGVGRFASHKLGKSITLITRKKDSPEIVVKINWGNFLKEKYLTSALVLVNEREPKHFTGNTTGTRIEISSLNEEFSRSTIRQIFRSVNSISSPFGGPADFSAKLEMVPPDTSLAGLLDVEKVLDMAPYRATCLIEDGKITYDYDFIPPPGLGRVEGRSVKEKQMQVPAFSSPETNKLKTDAGPILFEVCIYDLDSQVLQHLTPDKKGFKEFLRNNGGIRVYRDGIRIYDYGEPGNDWLDLGGSRVNHPVDWISNNQVIGAIHLDGSKSGGLVEKTNREGFIEDATYEVFYKVIQFSIAQIIFERNQDKARLRSLYSVKKIKQPVLNELSELREALKKFPEIAAEILPIVDDVESKYLFMRDNLVTAAGAGLTLSIVIHEVEKAVKGFTTAINREASHQELKNLALHLNELLDGLTYLTRRSGRKQESLETIVSNALLNTNYRAKAHKIEIINGLKEMENPPQVICTRRLVIATLMNLIDNSIYWMDSKGDKIRKIFIGYSNISEGPTLFVADTGPGFQDSPENLVQPFMTRRPEGMGLGLHIADLIMRAHDGRLIFPSRDDLDLPEEYCGAIVGLQFPKL